MLFDRSRESRSLTFAYQTTKKYSAQRKWGAQALEAKVNGNLFREVWGFFLYHVYHFCMHKGLRLSRADAGTWRQLQNANYLGESFPPGGSHFILRLEWLRSHSNLGVILVCDTGFEKKMSFFRQIWSSIGKTSHSSSEASSTKDHIRRRIELGIIHIGVRDSRSCTHSRMSSTSSQQKTENQESGPWSATDQGGVIPDQNVRELQVQSTIPLETPNEQQQNVREHQVQSTIATTGNTWWITKWHQNVRELQVQSAIPLETPDEQSDIALVERAYLYLTKGIIIHIQKEWPKMKREVSDRRLNN